MMNKILRNSLIIFLFFIGKKNQAQFNIDTNLVANYDSIEHYYLFKPNLNISIQNLIVQYKSNFHLGNSCAFFQTQSFSDNLMKGTFYRFQQSYNGIPVEGSMFNVSYDSLSFPVSANGITYDIKDLNVNPNVSETSAIDSAIFHVPSEKYYWQDSTLEAEIKIDQDDTSATNYPTNAQLVILPLLNQSSISYILCYKVRVKSMNPDNVVDVFINTINGNVEKVLQISIDCLYTASDQNKNSEPDCSLSVNNNSSINLICSPNNCQQGSANLHKFGSQYIYTDKFPYGILQTCSYRLKDNCTGTTLYTRKYVNPGPNIEDIRDNTNVWTNGGDDQNGATAHFSLRVTHDYFRTRYGRNSWDGNYTQLTTYINWANGEPQARWTGNGILVSKAYTWQHPIIFFDGIGHEFTHGITMTTANLTYTNESGALNEGFSDIFGTMVEYYGSSVYNTGQSPNYKIFELSNVSAGGSRNMANPNQFLQPDTYNQTAWASTTSTVDFGGVHTNSGVLNFWFYLLAEGGNGNNDLGNPYCVKGIGRDKASDIAWRTLTMKLFPSANYSDCRFLSIQAASDLYGSNSPEVAEVIAAWYAVGIGGQPIYSLPYVYVGNKTDGTSQNYNFNLPVRQQSYIANSGSIIDISSGSEVILLPATDINSGSTYYAHISTACSGNGLGGARIANSTNNTTDPVNADISITSFLSDNFDFNVIPNPTNGIFKVSHSNALENPTSITVLNTLGAILYQNNKPNAQEIEIDITNAPNGLYIVKVNYTGKIHTKRIIKG